MPAVISQASEHINTNPRTSYCTEDDVRLLLAGVEPDDAGTELGAWLSTDDANKVIRFYAARNTKHRVDQLARRDFEYHIEVDVVVDGPGSDTLRLDMLGFYPLLDVTAITMSGSAENLDDYVWYRDGRLTVGDVYSTTYTRPHPTNVFPTGKQNIALTITWGYVDPPDDIRLAQAYYTAAQVLHHIGRSGTQSPGMLGGIQQIQYEDFRVTNYQRSRFGSSIEMFEKEAKRIVSAYTTPRAVSLRPGDGISTNEARRNIFGRGRTDLG